MGHDTETIPSAPMVPTPALHLETTRPPAATNWTEIPTLPAAATEKHHGTVTHLVVAAIVATVSMIAAALAIYR